MPRVGRRAEPGTRRDGEPTGFWALPAAECEAKTAEVSIPLHGGRQPAHLPFAPVDDGWPVAGVPADFLAPFEDAELVVPVGRAELPPFLGWETERVAGAVAAAQPGAAIDAGVSMVGAGLAGTTAGPPDLAVGYLGAIVQELVWAGASNPVLTWRDRATGGAGPVPRWSSATLVQCHYERDVTPDGEGVTDRSCPGDVAPVPVELPGLGESAADAGLDTAAGAGADLVADLFIEQLTR